jgi:hypothetical protein
MKNIKKRIEKIIFSKGTQARLKQIGEMNLFDINKIDKFIQLNSFG